MKFDLVKTNIGIIPATDQDKEKFDKVGIGEIFICKTLDFRNAGFHRKFFALIHIAWDNMPEKYMSHFPTEDTLRRELVKRAGWYEHYKDLKGNDQYIAKSISFDKMGQEEFEKLYNRVIDVIIKWLIPNLDKDLLENEIMNFI